MKCEICERDDFIIHCEIPKEPRGFRRTQLCEAHYQGYVQAIAKWFEEMKGQNDE